MKLKKNSVNDLERSKQSFSIYLAIKTESSMELIIKLCAFKSNRMGQTEGKLIKYGASIFYDLLPPLMEIIFFRYFFFAPSLCSVNYLR